MIKYSIHGKITSYAKGEMEVILSYFRTAGLYLVLIGVVRLMGKRQIGEMEPAEFVVTMLVANLASIPMQDGAIPLYSGLVPILTVLGLELVLSWATLKSTVLRRLLCGKPVLLIENGHLIQENLRRTRVSLDELTGHLREKDVLDISSVQYAILETNGSLTVFPYPQECPASAADAGIKPSPRYLPIAIIQDGELLEDNLRRTGKNEKWVDSTLRKYHTDRKGTLMLTVDQGGKVCWIGKEGTK